MKAVVLAMLLAVAQTSPPIPRQTANNSTQASPNIKSKSAANQAPSLPAPATAKTNGDRPAKDNSREHHPENDRDTVTTRQLPPVTVNTPRRDWADWGTLGFNLLLVGVGVLQVVLLCLTLRVIRRQAQEMLRQRILMRRQWREMSQQTESLKEYVEETKKISRSGEDSAKAALLNAKAVISAERAWVIADLSQMAVKMPPPENWCRITDGRVGVMGTEAILRGEYLWHRLKFTNMGRTAARILAYEYHCGFYDHKCGTLQIETIDYNGDYNRMLGVGNEVSTDNVIDIHKFVGNPLSAEIGPPTWKNWMIVLVSVTYDHVFSSEGPQQEVSRFVFDINAQTMRRVALAKGDKEQIGKREIWPKNTGQPN